MGIVKSAQRERFEEDTFPHLEALWRAALWLTMRRSFAEELVLKTMTRTYRSWHGSVGTVGTKARLFRILTREFFDADNRRHQAGWFLPEQCGTAANTDDGGPQYPVASIDRQELLLLTKIPDVSVKQAIARLRPQSRLIMMLHWYERFSYTDIAYITDLRKDSVKSILSRVRRLIPRYLVRDADCTVTARDRRTTDRALMPSFDDGRV